MWPEKAIFFTQRLLSLSLLMLIQPVVLPSLIPAGTFSVWLAPRAALEQYRDGQIEPVQQPADHPVGGAGLEGDVGQDHPHRRAGTHALDGGQEAAGAPDPFRDRFHSSQCAGGSPERKSGYTVSRVTGGPGLLIEQRLNFCC